MRMLPACKSTTVEDNEYAWHFVIFCLLSVLFPKAPHPVASSTRYMPKGVSSHKKDQTIQKGVAIHPWPCGKSYVGSNI